ncbi:TlpA family protein disulfide reductase [Nocardiopsis gilva YIM 90087]|uniref:TlpA family protein disulfide reductase n=1 Tax=Nocardiopsis gilva YIM 90087 TaxID=1235441 RepID=A0A223SC38_9ACTN|nr:TlpA disulfide reductase family protein [Nocardiopsis gilva]ASU85731.1 TlpA family protein disulfide reductase [Nocardiopsis gilva YIM 90087]
MPCYRSGARVRPVLLRAAAAIAVLAALSGCAGGGATQTGSSSDNRYIAGDGSSTSYDPGDRHAAPDVSGDSLDGDPISLSDYRGDVLVVNFWASWCGPCRSETPVLKEVRSEFADDGVEFLGVNIKDDKTAAQAFEKSQGISYPSIYDQPGEVVQKFRDTVPPQAIPSTLVLDREGRIAARVIGETDYKQLKGLVETVVAEDGGDAGTA